MEHIARVHRFHDTVGVHVGDGQTVYLSASQARELGEVLIEGANDLSEYAFQDSPFTTTEIN